MVKTGGFLAMILNVDDLRQEFFETIDVDPSDAKGLLEVIDIDGNGKAGWCAPVFFWWGGVERRWGLGGKWILKKHISCLAHLRIRYKPLKKGGKNGLLSKKLGEEEKFCKHGGFVFLLEEITQVTWDKKGGDRDRRDLDMLMGKSHPIVGALKGWWFTFPIWRISDVQG